eukprot:4359126-Pleurochrysis_carterae.AAC.2
MAIVDLSVRAAPRLRTFARLQVASEKCELQNSRSKVARRLNRSPRPTQSNHPRLSWRVVLPADSLRIQPELPSGPGEKRRVYVKYICRGSGAIAGARGLGAPARRLERS